MSHRLSPILLLVLAGCVRTETARFPAASEHPEEERRPDGVSLELDSEPPGFDERESSDATVTTLRAPLGLDQAEDVIASFFQAVLQEDIGELSKLLRSGAMAYDTRTSGAPRTLNLLSQWRNRFEKFDYLRLRSRVVYRPSEVRSYRPPHLDALPLEVRELDPSGDEGARGRTAMVLRAAILSRNVDGEQLFGPEIYFWLERDGNRFEILQVAENVPY